MDMSKAALPAISGKASKAEQSHPLYNEWMAHEADCRLRLINGQDFKNWLFQREAGANRHAWTKHPEYSSFLSWMRETQAGARPCRENPDMPYGLSFPENFKVWLTGERW